MNENFTTTELLIQYLDGELDEANRTALEQRIVTDINVSSELESLRIARQAVKSYALKKHVHTIHSEMMKELKQPVQKIAPVKSMMRYVVRIAAVFIILLATAVVHEYVSLSSQKLYGELYNPYITTLSRGNETNSALEEAYRQNNFNQVISLFEKNTNPSADDYFIAGNAYLQQHAPLKGIDCFLSLQKLNAQQGTHLFEEDASFYLALAYLQNKETNKALQLLKPINADKNHSYHDKVSDLQIFKLEMLLKKTGSK